MEDSDSWLANHLSTHSFCKYGCSFKGPRIKRPSSTPPTFRFPSQVGNACQAKTLLLAETAAAMSKRASSFLVDGALRSSIPGRDATDGIDTDGVDMGPFFLLDDPFKQIFISPVTWHSNGSKVAGQHSTSYLEQLQ